MLRIFYLPVFLFFLNGLYAQEVYSIKSISGKMRKKYEEAQHEYRSGHLSKAQTLFEKLSAQSPTFIDAFIQLGSVNYELKNYSKAEIAFENSIRLDSFYKIKVYYTLALVQYRLEKFLQAAGNMEVFLFHEKENKDLLVKARELYKNINFGKEAVKQMMNVEMKTIRAFCTNFSEYMPSIDAAGQRAYFTRRTPMGDEDIYVSVRLDTGWSQPQALTELNSPFNEGSPTVSADGNFMVFTSCDRRDGLGGCDLYYTQWEGMQWSAPRNLGEQINTPAYESQACFSNNGRTLHFVSNRKGTLGGHDLWVSHRKKDGSWSFPKNLGEPVNTTGDDVSPFVHPNGNTLYFASDAHTGMGGKDLYVSKLDSFNHWTPPVNLGFPINSIGDESSWIVLPDGKTAWMASDKEYVNQPELKPHLDLYEIELPVSLQITPASYVQIAVFDKQTNTPLQANIKIFNLSTQKKVMDQSTDSKGLIIFSLPTGSDYGIQVHRELYNFFSDQFLCAEYKSIYKPLLLKVGLAKTETSREIPFVLKNIFFETGSDVLLPESRFELDALAQFLIKNSQIRMRIEAHTDDVGTESDNQNLSQLRAQAVSNYLVSKSIAFNRLELKGLGESRPVADNATSEGRRLNRRIEFTIID